MKIKVKEKFRDIIDRSFHNPGDEIEVSSERGANILALGLGVRIDSPEPKPILIPEKKEDSNPRDTDNSKGKDDNAEAASEWESKPSEENPSIFEDFSLESESKPESKPKSKRAKKSIAE